MNNKPKLISLKRWGQISTRDFEKMYGIKDVELMDQWSDSGKNWKDAKESYEIFVEWYNSRFTKLGRVLE